MLNNLENIYLQNSDYLKLKFNYFLSSTGESYKFDYLLRLLGFDSKTRLSVRDFLLSVLTNIISPFLCLQSSNVKWSTVSIVYESNRRNPNNLYLIPLKNVRGQLFCNDLEEQVLKMSLRFQNTPRPTILKIYGISLSTEESEMTTEKNLKACEKAFTEKFMIENTSIEYHYIHAQTKSFLAEQRKIKSGLKSKNIHRKPILALADI